jgi:serine/threonine-protein kinase
MGPLAPVLVKRSAQQTEDPRVLCELLGEALTDDADRTAFLAFARRWAQSARKSARPPPEAAGVPGPGRTGQVPSRLTAQQRAQLEAALAPHLGPIAKVLVERVAHEAPDLAAASETLARSIPEGESRRTFLRTVTLVQPPPRKQRPTPPPAPPPAPPRAAPSSPAGVPRVTPQRAPAGPTQGMGATQPLVATRFIGEDVLLRAERSLARALGPMARALVRRSAQSARNVAELYATLAQELPEGPERDRFLASRDQAG